MSPQQYDTFYWPPQRKVMMGLIEEGFVPLLLCEGGYTSRLETIADIPKSKCIYWSENVDWKKAKEILGDTACIRGGIPASILFSGTTGQMNDCTKERIDVVGKGGGNIVDCDLWFDETRHENVKNHGRVHQGVWGVLSDLLVNPATLQFIKFYETLGLAPIMEQWNDERLEGWVVGGAGPIFSSIKEGEKNAEQ